MSKQKILGDYQTPPQLALEILIALFKAKNNFTRLLEPTCGQGNFIHAAIEHSSDFQEIIGLEIQPHYVKQAQQIQSGSVQIKIIQQDIFQINLQKSLEWETNGQLLIVGNPPWVTNSAQGEMGGNNLPQKSNFKKLNGLDAITGKSNFDITEYIWIKLLNEFQKESVTIALLCKQSVARKVAQHIYQHRLPASSMKIFKVDADVGLMSRLMPVFFALILIKELLIMIFPFLSP